MRANRSIGRALRLGLCFVVPVLVLLLCVASALPALANSGKPLVQAGNDPLHIATSTRVVAAAPTFGGGDSVLRLLYHLYPIQQKVEIFLYSHPRLAAAQQVVQSFQYEVRSSTAWHALQDLFDRYRCLP